MNPIESVVAQTHELAGWLPGTDPSTPVPSCPAWVLRDLVEHVGATQRWVSSMVAEQVSDPMAAFGLGFETVPESPDRWPGWLTDSAAAVVTAFRDAPEGASVFDPSFAGDGVRFWATRLFGEISVHRLDAALTTGHAYDLAPDLAALAVDDWLGTMASAGWAANVPGFADAMRGSGQTIAWVARDVDRAWVLRRTDAPLDLTRTDARAGFAAGDGAVVVEGDALDLLHLVSRRRPLAEADASAIRGDRAELVNLVDHMDWVGAG
jgi:uncharacterized protein (TIGR03083 family)